MLILSRRVDESIVIGDEIVVSVVDIKGDQVKLGIEAPREIKVYRREVYEAIQAENLAAARTSAVLPEIKRLAEKQPAKKRKPDGPSSEGEEAPSSRPPSSRNHGDEKPAP